MKRFFFKPGIFITLEGGEGAGKTTQVHRLNEFFQNGLGEFLKKGYGAEVVLTREPGGSLLGEAIRSIVKNPDFQIGAIVNRYLFMAARIDNNESVVVPALERGAIVIKDRYQDSTEAYQIFGQMGGNLDELAHVQAMFAKDIGLYPDITFLLDTDVETGLRRSHARDEGRGVRCRFEEEKIEFHERVRRGFHHLARQSPQRIKLIDATRSPEEIQQELREYVIAFMDKNYVGISDEGMYVRRSML